jgi:hypothetical protein
MPTYQVTRPVPDTSFQQLSFIRDDKMWYADLPEFLDQGLGDRANLLMVDGADTLLDVLSKGHTHITLKLSTDPFSDWQLCMHKSHRGMNAHLLVNVGHAPVDYGAYYQVSVFEGKQYDHSLWLCPVTEYVFGSYPDTIYASIVLTHS